MTLPKTVLSLSGKGGTGKTVCAINLAWSIKDKGRTVGLLDCDVDSANVCELLKLTEDLKIDPVTKEFIPIERDGVKIFTMDAIAKGKEISMRGEEYAQIIRDVVKSTKWDSEYLVADLPAGTSDELLTLIDVLGDRLIGSVVVAQPSSILDAERVLRISQRHEVPIIGLVENMVGVSCDHGVTYYPFGEAKGGEIAQKYGVDYLGAIPLVLGFRSGVEEGKPFFKPEDSGPIMAAVERVLVTVPTSVSLVAKMKEKVKEVARDTLIRLFGDSIQFMNREVNITEYQKKYSAPGGRVVEWNFVKHDHLKKRIRERAIVDTFYLRLENGIVKALRNPKVVDIEAYLEDAAFIWAVRGKDANGLSYSFRDMWFEGRLEFYGLNVPATQMFVQFISSIFDEIRPRLVSRYGELLGRL